MAEIRELWPTSHALTPARERLRQAIDALDQAKREAEAGTQPLRRLEQVTAEADQLELKLIHLLREDEAELGRWIAEGSIGARPQPSAATAATNARLAALAPDLRGVAAALPAARAMQQASVERVGAAATERDLALSAVAIEAAGAVAQQLTEALNGALAIEAKLRGLVEVLRTQRDDGGGSAERIERLIVEAKRSAAVPRDPAAGRRLLASLARDPSAVL